MNRNESRIRLTFQQADSLRSQGRLWEAEQLYRSVLGVNDRDFSALCGLGQIRLQQTQFGEAVDLFRRAIKLDRKSAEAHHNLAFGLTGLKRFEEAERQYRKALSIRPSFPEAHNNLGHTLQLSGRLEVAMAHYKKALILQPDYAEARNNLGNALHLLGKSEEAIPHYEKALVIRPEYAEAYWNLANALRAIGRLDEAITHYNKSILIRPSYVEAYNGIGNTYQILGRFDESIAQYKKALAIAPTYIDALINLGHVFGELNRQKEAIAYYDKAIAIDPDNLNAILRRAGALARSKRFTEATKEFEKALAFDAMNTIDPDNTAAFNGLAGAALAACDWALTTQVSKDIATRIANGRLVEPFLALGYGSDPSVHLACARIYARLQAPVGTPALWRGSKWCNEKIRIAYVSAGFHDHPTAYLTARLLEIHDRSRFEVIGISMSPDDGSEIRTRLIKAFDRFHDVRTTTDDEVAKLIGEMPVDIVIDRSGYTSNTRSGIFARRPAPIQVNYIGFPGTLGADWYDYVIADRIVLPFDQQPFFSERIVHLPVSYLVQDSSQAISNVTPRRQEAGLPENGFVFCCFNKNDKITRSMFEIWMRLLRRVEGSVLWLLRTNPSAEENLRKAAAERGVDSARLVFAERVKRDAHLARHRLADLFLDTLPYNAHTTASDALWTGLPLITCLGECFAGRVAASLLEAVGLSELVTNSLEEYESLSLQLAVDPDRLRTVRAKLDNNRSTYGLFDAEAYRRNIESAYTTMWEMWQRGESPRSFSVANR
jgi:protein O-GlcNAc transferase